MSALNARKRNRSYIIFTMKKTMMEQINTHAALASLYRTLL